MRLVFVHGWGFDATLWDGIAGALTDYSQCRVEVGFLGGAATTTELSPDDVLIGHSLGLLWGLAQGNWRQVIAINSFARFSGAPEAGACVPPASLRAMRLSLARNAGKTLANFYRAIDHTALADRYDAKRLADGLALLESQHITEPPPQPWLILAARHDPLVPVTASEHLAAITDSAVTWSETGGHLLPLTRPLWCADVIRAFLA
ncbi:MAG: alpha/beta hydrolase [Rhizomicrobium sp.]|nr:alpha/beta hydrolase [Rhizomicrobium sp.]